MARMRTEEVYTGFFFWGDLREEDHLEDPGMDGMDLQGVGLGWTLVNAVMNLRVPQNLSNFLTD